VVYLPIDREAQRERIAHRQAATPGQTFPMSSAETDHWRAMFEVPDAAELNDRELPDPPAGWPAWPQWAAHRWPSLADS
jgi:hypothetical protein